MWGERRHGHWILAFALATSHLIVSSGSVQAGVENYLDGFDERSYANSDGSIAWTGPWEEVGEDTDPTAGDWQVVEDVGFARYALGKKGAEGLGVQRVADLDGFTSAALVFDYRRNFLPSGKAIEVQVSSTGTAGPWTTIQTISGVSPPVVDPAYLPVTLDISAFISSETAVRFMHPSDSSSFGTPMTIFIDNVEIAGDTSNNAPVLSAPTSLSGNEGAPIGFTATATDTDPFDALTFSLAGTVPQGASITTDGVFSWTPTESQGPGGYSFEVVVSDDGAPSLSDTETVTVTVAEVNAAPTVTGPGDQANAEGDSISVFASASDSDIPANTLTWSASGLPPGLSIDASTGEISGSVEHTGAAASPHSVILTVSDGDQNGQSSLQWTVTNSNRPPELSAPTSVAGNEDTLIEFTASASDPDSDTLSFSLAGAVPSGASISGGGVFSWTPTEAQGPASYTFDVVVSDDGTPTLSDTGPVTVSVHEVNTPPQVAGPGNQVNVEGDSVALTVSASDSDVPTGLATWSATGLPPGLSIDSSTGQITGVLPYNSAKATPYEVQVTMTDGHLADTAGFSWTVTNINRAPTLSPPTDISGEEGQVISFVASASDPDAGDTLRFSIAGAVPAGASITSAGLFTWVPAEPQGPGSYTFQVVVTDTGTPALSDVGAITIDVLEVNVAPSAGSDRYTVVRGGTLAIGAAGVLANDNDPDGHGLTAWVVDGPDDGTLALDTDGSFVYTHSGNTEEDDAFTYRISDGHGGHATAIVTVEVEPPPNRAPVANPDSIVLMEDTVATFNPLVNDTDPEGDDISIHSVAVAHGGEMVLDGNGMVRFVPTRDFFGTIEASYRVADEVGASAAAKIHIEVTPVNDEPRAVADRVVLTQYLSQRIPVLVNDSDPDGDVLILTAVGVPEHGEVEVTGDEVLYTAPKGWTGTTDFTYVVEDGSGGASRGHVTVEVPRETLAAAQELSIVLGTEQLKSKWIGSIFDSKVDLAISPLMGLQLFVQAFFQSLDGIELSLALLGMTAVVLAGFSLASRLPMIVPLGSPRYWSAVLVGRESQLEIHEKPSRASKVIYQLRPATKGIESEPARRLMPRGWIPVETPRGQGWAETDRLTEQVDAQSFMEDERPSGMVDQLANRLSNGKDITQLLGRRGLIVDLGAGLEVIDPETLRGLVRGRHRGPFEEEFWSEIVTPFQAAYAASGEISADSSHSSSVLLPTEILNFRYLTVGRHHESTWLVLFEYEKGRPRIVGLLRDE